MIQTITRMKNGHLPAHMAWIAYKLQLWPGLRYGLGTMTNDLEATDAIFDKDDYDIMPILARKPHCCLRGRRELF